MLERLDEVPWSTLTHAYGPAGDVPDLLRGLTSPDPDEREAALSELHGAVWHQGAVYPATPHVVPFLLELLAAPALEGKAGLLRYLALLAQGRADDAPGLAGRVADAVRRGAPLYEVLLDDPAPGVAAAAAALLAGAAAEAPSPPGLDDAAPDAAAQRALAAVADLAALADAGAGPATTPAGGASGGPDDDAGLVRLAAACLSLLFVLLVALLILLAVRTGRG